MRARRSTLILRLGCLLLAGQAALVGVWALFDPRSFYSDFPPLLGSWVASFPPYNEHLVRDVGGLYSAWAVLFLWVSASLDRVLLKASMLSWLVFAIAHFVFHLANTEGISGGDLIVQTTSLALFVALPVALLIVGRRRKGADFTWARSV